MKIGARDVNSRAYVARFNFSGTDQQKKVGALSGGERKHADHPRDPRGPTILTTTPHPSSQGRDFTAFLGPTGGGGARAQLPTAVQKRAPAAGRSLGAAGLHGMGQSARRYCLCLEATATVLEELAPVGSRRASCLCTRMQWVRAALLLVIRSGNLR